MNIGITQKFLSSQGLPSSIDEDRILTRDQAISFYRKYFWGPMRLAEIAYQALAARVFDLGANQEPETAGALLQGAIHNLWNRTWLRSDGKIGSATFGIANQSDPVKLLEAFRRRAADHYNEIADKNSALKPDLNRWLIRLAS